MGTQVHLTPNRIPDNITRAQACQGIPHSSSSPECLENLWGEVREDILGLLGVLNFLWAEDGRSRVESAVQAKGKEGWVLVLLGPVVPERVILQTILRG